MVAGLVSGIAAADISRRPEFSLGEQPWFDRYVRPQLERIRSESVGDTGAMVRGAKAKQGQMVSAQFGGDTGFLGDAAISSMSGAFRRAMRIARMKAKERGDLLTQQAMMERQQKRARGLQQLGTVTGVEAALSSLIPYAGPFLAGSAGAVGTGLQAALGQERSSGPLRTIDWGNLYSEEEDPWGGFGGGGESNLANFQRQQRQQSTLV